MDAPPFAAVLLAALVFLSGCVGTAPAPSITDQATHSDEAQVAHFIVNNHDHVAYKATIYLVRNSNESQAYFPLEVTFQNGSTTIIADPNGAPAIPGDVHINATHVEPAAGTIHVVARQIPPRSTLHLVIETASPDAKTLRVFHPQGDRSDLMSVGLTGGICTGTQAHVTTFNGSHSSSKACGNVSDVDFPKSSETVTPAGNHSSASD